MEHKDFGAIDSQDSYSQGNQKLDFFSEFHPGHLSGMQFLPFSQMWYIKKQIFQATS